MAGLAARQTAYRQDGQEGSQGDSHHVGTAHEQRLRVQDPRPHVHYHVRPRYSKPQTVGGEVFVDLDFGEHHRRDTPREVSPETLQEIKRLLLAVENRED